MVLGISLALIFVGIVWIALGMSFWDKTVRFDFRDPYIPLWLTPLLLVLSMVLGPFAQRMLGPSIDRYFPHIEDE